MRRHTMAPWVASSSATYLLIFLRTVCEEDAFGLHMAIQNLLQSWHVTLDHIFNLEKKEQEVRAGERRCLLWEHSWTTAAGGTLGAVRVPLFPHMDSWSWRMGWGWWNGPWLSLLKVSLWWWGLQKVICNWGKGDVFWNFLTWPIFEKENGLQIAQIQSCSI